MTRLNKKYLWGKLTNSNYPLLYKNNQKLQEEKGVTILVLIVTIIIMLILVGITISNIIGDNGIISQTHEAINAYGEYKKGEEAKAEELASGLKNKDEKVQILLKQSVTDWTNEDVIVSAEVKNMPDGHYLYMRMGNDGPWQRVDELTVNASEYTGPQTITACLAVENNPGQVKPQRQVNITVSNIDNKKPSNDEPILSLKENETYKTIIADNKQTDTESGLDESKTKYAIRKKGESNWSNWQQDNIFIDLEDGTIYEVKTKSTDNVGNEQESEISEIKTKTRIILATVSSVANNTYTGNAYTPEPIITYNQQTLTKDTHYSLSYANNINAGSATIRITGKGDYIGETTTSFTIYKASITVPTVKTNRTYNATSQSPEWNNYNTNLMTIGGTTSATNAGTYTATFTLKNTANYQWNDGTTVAKSVNWTMSAYNLSNATVATVSAYTYDGNAKKPTPAVTVPIPSGSTTTLTNNTHFTYSYSNNTNAGTATVTATAKSGTNYTGSKSKTFTINKATPTLTLSNITVIEGNSGSFTATYNGDGTLTASPSNTGVATVSVSGKTVTVKGVAAGSETITVSASAGTNYVAKSATCTATVQVALYSVSEGSPTYHRSLSSAVSTCTAGGTVTALANTTESDSLTINKNITINTNGKTLTRSAGTITTSANTTTTISGGGTIKSTGNDKLTVVNGGLSLASGTILQSVGTAVEGASNRTGAISLGGTVTTTGGSSVVYLNNSTQSCSLTGTFKNTSTSYTPAIQIYGNNKVTFSGNCNSNYDGAFTIGDNVTLTITGGTITCQRCAIARWGGAGTVTINISGGTLSNLEEGWPVISISNVTSCKTNLTVTGGNITGKLRGIQFLGIGTCKVTGGNITGNKYEGVCVDNSSATLTTGGTSKIKGVTYAVYIDKGTWTNPSTTGLTKGKDGYYYKNGTVV